VNIPQWAIHRSARWYEAPSEFRPERWTPEFVERLPRCAFIPFSAGPRVCIGQSMVTVVDALLIANLVRAFDFELDGPPMNPVEGLTLLPGEGGRMPLRLRRRVPVAPLRTSGA
jgi:cytochrome P450